MFRQWSEKMKMNYAIVGLIAACGFAACAAELDLSGTWTLTQADKPEVTCPVAVPGGIYTALYDAKLIPDPYFAQNEKLTQWPGRTDWLFSRSFTLPEGFADAKAVTLRLEDVDCFATVKVNGHEVGRTSNRFQRYDFDVKPFLKQGDNRIEALFESTERISYAESNKYDRAYNIANATVRHINLVRTVQCHGGWDWGITQMEMGLMGTVKLIATDIARIDYVYTTQDFAKDWSSAAVTVTVEATVPDGGRNELRPSRCSEFGRVAVYCDRSGPDKARPSLETELTVTLGDVSKSEKVTLSPGANKVSITLDVKNPKLWWPVGYGDQPLYPLAVTLGDAKVEKRIGLRKAEVYNEEDAEPDPATGKKGKPMVVVINGRRIFCKGADWIPCDAFENRQTRERYRDLLDSAVAANMNMLRVWGGGQFEHPAFYELCDEKGILLWHDFMFSCATYPGDERFMAGVRKEIAHQLRNLRDHASIALWCGDNECIGAAGWFGAEQREANIKLCVKRAKELEKLCAEYDPTRCFWPSSPCLGPGNYGDGWKDDSSGDMHFWQVWFGDKPFSHYFTVRPRFCSEFGFQSYPTKEEALTFVTPDHLNPTAPDFFYHQKSPNGNKFIMQMIMRNFRFPEGVDAVLYLSHVQQAMAIRTAVEAWRHLQPRCMGIIYWQLNNNWPVASWSSLDYSGKWKPLHYNMKRAYAPLAISAAPKWGDPSTIEVWAVNDRDEVFDGTASLDLWTFSGERKPFATPAVRIAPRSAAKVGEWPLAAFGDNAARSSSFLRMRLVGGGSRLAATAAAAMNCVPPVSNEWMFDLFMNIDLTKTDIKTTFAEKDGKFRVTLSADRPAFFVWANVWRTRGEFDDNSFTLYPGEPRTLTFTPKTPVLTLDAFRKSFSVTHLRETYRGALSR